MLSLLTLSIALQTAPASDSSTLSAARLPDATYTLALQTEPRLRVAATLGVRGEEDGSSAFSAAPMWGGIDHCARYLHELAFFAVGKPIGAEHPIETAWILTHAPGAALEARWFLDPLETPLDPGLGNDYRPTLKPASPGKPPGSPGHFQLLGDTGLLTPDALQGDAQRRIRLEWKGFAEAGWEVASSFGDEPAGVTVEGPLPAFTHAVFLAGDLRLHRRDLHGTRLLFALAHHGEAFRFADDALVDLGTRIITAERDFFSDWSDPLFVVTLVPDERTDRQSLGGTGLTHSFALFMSRNFTLQPGSDDVGRVAHLLAHEHFHHWNGGKIKLEEPEQLGYWFSEGFTDFFARRILLRCGIYDVPEYVRRLNESLARYWQSPMRHEKNARIAADFWKNKDVGELPYRRGDLVALLLDHEIRMTSKRSLDDFFREALTRGRERGEICSTDNLLELAADYTSQEFADRLRTLIVDGADIELDPELGAPFLRLGHRKAGRDAQEATEIPFLEFVPGCDDEEARRRL